jgi:mannose-6-phosphate isomerase-like protein (cupin superfamily)
MVPANSKRRTQSKNLRPARRWLIKGRSPIHIEPKVWGREIWIANNPEYCGKVLEIEKGKRCSLHYHKLKLESFYLRRGKLKVRVKRCVEDAAIEEFELAAGECFDVHGDWYTRWRHWRTANYMSSQRSILTATPIG